MRKRIIHVDSVRHARDLHQPRGLEQVSEFVQAAHAQGWLVLDSAAVSYGQATPYFPVLDLLRRYCHLEEREDARTVPYVMPNLACSPRAVPSVKRGSGLPRW